MQVPRGHPLADGGEARGVEDDHRTEKLARGILEEPARAKEERKTSKEALSPLRIAPVELGHDPGRRALEDAEPSDLLRDRRDHLDCAGAGPDHADALAGELEGVVPAGGVEDLTAETADSLDVGKRGIDEAAHP